MAVMRKVILLVHSLYKNNQQYDVNRYLNFTQICTFPTFPFHTSSLKHSILFTQLYQAKVKFNYNISTKNKVELCL